MDLYIFYIHFIYYKKNNCGICVILKFLIILNGESSSIEGLSADLIGNNLAFYKFTT